MAGRAQARFVARGYSRSIDRSDAEHRGANEYGVDCIYCREYFCNIKKKPGSGYICRACKKNAISF